MISSANKLKVLRSWNNFRGWKTNRKIVVLESDDWGSIRMPSREVYNQLLAAGIPVDRFPYTRFDSMATPDDLEMLFEVLQSVTDKHGNPAILTANTIVGNPDFERIRNTQYQEYFVEPFTETLQRSAHHENSFKVWKQGMSANIFKPQFHGREHLNVNRWLEALRNNTGNVRFAFDLGLYDLSYSNEVSENSFMDALDFTSLSELDYQKESLRQGAQLFENIFGYKARTFIAPCYIWHPYLEQTLKEQGVELLQGSFMQFVPQEGNLSKHKRRIHYLGQRNHVGQIYSVRNCWFEPSTETAHEPVSLCLNQIDNAFKHRLPAVISTHRLNYIGSLDEENRSRNLPKLKQLLTSIVNKHPDVEFLSSDQLASLILNTTKTNPQ